MNSSDGAPLSSHGVRQQLSEQWDRLEALVARLPEPVAMQMRKNMDEIRKLEEKLGLEENAIDCLKSGEY